jgi:hypothetical protein
MQPIDHQNQSPTHAAQTARPSDAEGIAASAARPRATVVAPEVAARIVACRAAGESVSAITGSLHMTPGEVRAVLGADQMVAAPVRVPRGLGEALVTAIGAAR